MLFFGGGIIVAIAGPWGSTSCMPVLLLLRELGLLCILECRVNSSEREKRFVQPWKLHAWGFSPVCVRMCLV